MEKPTNNPQETIQVEAQRCFHKHVSENGGVTYSKVEDKVLDSLLRIAKEMKNYGSRLDTKL